MEVIYCTGPSPKFSVRTIMAFHCISIGGIWRIMRPIAEPISGLDERFISSASAARSFHNASVVRITGAGDLRLTGGAPNMERIAAEFVGWSLRLPRLRQRLRHSPAGLMAPVWIPEEAFSMSAHLRLHPVVLTEADITAAILHGDSNGDLDMERSPWNALVVDIAGGDLLLVIKMHHVMGDGLSGVSTLDVLLSESPGERPAPPPAPDVRAPANNFELFAAVWRHFCAANPTWAARRTAALAKPPLVRLRKVAGRNLRLLRPGTESGHEPRWRYGVTSTDLKTARMTARALGGSITDLVAAAGAYGVAESLPGRRSKAATIAVPLSEKPGPDAAMGNRTRIIPVTLLADHDRAGAVMSVRAQISAGVSAGLSASLTAGTWDAMATFLPAGFRPRYFAGQPVSNIMFWTSLDPSERIGILSSNYLDTLNVTVVAADDVDMDALLGAVRMVLTGAATRSATGTLPDPVPDPGDVWDSMREAAL